MFFSKGKRYRQAMNISIIAMATKITDKGDIGDMIKKKTLVYGEEK